MLRRNCAIFQSGPVETRVIFGENPTIKVICSTVKHESDQELISSFLIGILTVIEYSFFKLNSFYKVSYEERQTKQTNIFLMNSIFC